MVTQEKPAMDSETTERVEAWLGEGFDSGTQEEVRRLREEDPSALINAFYTTLKFGTGGLRGVMGVGTNRMNRYTVRFATQGLANYLNRVVEGERSVFIGYDSRNSSPEFAEEAARVLAGNGIKAYLCPELRPTPFVSFGCRQKRCSAAIMVTASHNPPEYNGYKVYWKDGGQIIAPHDKGIIDEVGKVKSIQEVKVSPKDSHLIETVGKELDESYLHELEKLQLYPAENQEKGKELKVVFSNLHGTGGTMVPQTLERWGFTSLWEVEEQKAPDGNFPTVAYPNPEEAAALELGIKKLNEVEGDLLLATDPDADRLGAVVRTADGATLLNGNQIASICLAHLCEAYGDKIPANGAFVKTIVTTELFKAIAEKHGRPCYDVLTGFKYIAEKIREWEESGEHVYLFGGEESYGYLLGTHARDKDAVISAALLTEAASHAKQQGLTLVEKLHQLYEEYGVYREALISIRFPETKEGRTAMDNALVSLRNTPPKEFAGVAVRAIEDYASGERYEVATDKKSTIKLPKSDVLLYWLEDESKLVVRPSGTEPKVKVYCGVVRHGTSVEQGIKEADEHLTKLTDALKSHL